MTECLKTFFAPQARLDGTHFSRNRPVSDKALARQLSLADFMLTEAYIEALLVDEELADQVWEAWDAGEIDDSDAFWAWLTAICKARLHTHSWVRQEDLEGDRRRMKPICFSLYMSNSPVPVL